MFGRATIRLGICPHSSWFRFCYHFWATVCKMVHHYAIRPLSVICLSVPSVCLSVMLVYCGHTVGWIKMKLGMEVGLSRGDVVLDGDLAAPPQKVHSPQFLAHVCCGQTAGWIKMPLGMEVDLSPGNIVLDGDPAKKGHSTPPTFRPMSIVVVAKWSPISATAEHLLLLSS